MSEWLDQVDLIKVEAVSLQKLTVSEIENFPIIYIVCKKQPAKRVVQYGRIQR